MTDEKVARVRKLERYRMLIGLLTLFNLVLLGGGALAFRWTWALVIVAFVTGGGFVSYSWIGLLIDTLKGWGETIDAWGKSIEGTKRASEALQELEDIIMKRRVQ